MKLTSMEKPRHDPGRILIILLDRSGSMNSRAPVVILAAVLVIICVAGTLTVYGIGHILGDDAGFPNYTVTGTETDGTGIVGTVTCTDTRESSIQPVLRFDYSLETSEGTMELTSYLFLDTDGMPMEGFYTYTGTRDIQGTQTDVWTDSDGEFSYCVSSDGDVLGIVIETDGVSAFAEADQATP